MWHNISKIVVCLAFITALSSGLSEDGCQGGNCSDIDESAGAVSEVVSQFQIKQNRAFEELLQLIDSMSTSISSMNRRIQILEQRLVRRNLLVSPSDIHDGQEMRVEELEEERASMNERLSSIEHGYKITNSTLSSISATVANLSSNIGRLQSRTEYVCIPPDKTSITATAYDQYAFWKPPVVTGKTFNGSSLKEISNSVPGVSHPDTITVEISTPGDWWLTSMKMHDPNSTQYHRAPVQIGGNTKEVFSFYEPGCCYPRVAFSYLSHLKTPSDVKIRIAVYAYSRQKTRAVGLAFLPDSVSLETYFSNKESYGKYLVLNKPVDSIVVKDADVLAKAVMTNERKSILRIEITRVPKCSVN